MLFVMHTLEVNLIDFKGFVVSGLPEKAISFEDTLKRKNSLMLMQCLAEYSLSFSRIAVKARIEKHTSYDLMF